MKSHRCSGFSLVELMIASLIVAAAGALLVGGLVGANRSTEYRLGQILSAQWLANQLALLDDRISEATLTGGTILPLDDATWTLSVEDADEPLTPLAKTTITVTRKDFTSHVVTFRPRLVAP
jgi:prepilin-type N-terminal cleavage/methylation domain-containing protein